MPAITRPAANSTPEQLCFNSIPGFTVRADFAGGELFFDFGAVELDGVDHCIGLIDLLTLRRFPNHAMRAILLTPCGIC